MPLDNILYDSPNVMDIDVTNVGASDKLLYPDTKGMVLLVDQTHTGEAEAILYDRDMVVRLILIGGYSRSRVVNK